MTETYLTYLTYIYSCRYDCMHVRVAEELVSSSSRRWRMRGRGQQAVDDYYVRHIRPDIAVKNVERCLRWSSLKLHGKRYMTSYSTPWYQDGCVGMSAKPA